LIEGEEMAADLLDWRAAVALSESSDPNGFWSVEAAIRASELIEDLEIAPAQSSERGLWASWLGLGPAAACALSDIGPAVQARGGNALRMAVGSCVARFGDHPDDAVREFLRDLMSFWQTPAADRPIAGDRTITELLETQQPVFRSGSAAGSLETTGSAAETEPVGEPIDLSALVDLGLVEPTAAAELEQVGPLSWKLKIDLRTDVAESLRNLRVCWQEIVESDGEVTGAAELDGLARAYGSLLARTPLSFSWVDIRSDLQTRDPAPPHLPDVVAVVSHGSLRAPFTFMEGLGRDPRTDALAGVLETIIPHRDSPTGSTVEVRAANRASPIGRNRGNNMSDLVLQARGLVAEGSQRSLRSAGRIYKRILTSVEDLDVSELGGVVASSREQLAQSIEKLVQRCFSGSADPGAARVNLRAAAVFEEMAEVADILSRELADISATRSGAKTSMDEVVEVANALNRVRSFLGYSAGAV
jgi:hypothetical protein